MTHRYSGTRTLSALTIACLLAASTAARAQDVPFAFLIDKGWQSFFSGSAVRLNQSMTSWYARGQIYGIVNGQKGAQIGTARMHAFSRTVPDPTFAGIGPLAGLIEINLGFVRGHLTVFDTPGGLRSSVALLSAGGIADVRASGAWALADGSGVAGGTAADMVVGGVVHLGTPMPVANIAVGLAPYFPVVPFLNDSPFYVWASTSSLPWQVGTGSSYHHSAYGPIRTYMRSDAGGFFDDYTSAISILHTGGMNYAVLTCSWNQVIAILSPAASVPNCALSGVGTLARLTGVATSYEVNALDSLMRWQAWLAP